MLFRIKREYEVGADDRKMVDLAAINAVKEVDVTTNRSADNSSFLGAKEDFISRSRNRKVHNMLPTTTMVMEENPHPWYKKFSRNIHGLRSEKPYSNLQWPPKQ